MKFHTLQAKASTVWVVLVCFTSYCLPSYSWAQDNTFSSRKNIAIVGFAHGIYLDEESNAYKTIRSTLQEKPGYQVLDASTVEVGITNNAGRALQSSTEKLEKAYEFFVQGVEHYRNLDLTAAIRDLNRSVKGYREGIASLEDNHYLLYAHLYLGMALYFDGRQEEGRKFIQEMVKLDAQRKTRTLPARDFPPKIVEIHKNETQKVQKIASGTIIVDSTPTAARVMLDGMDVGETPITLSNVPKGQHFVAIDQSGHEVYKKLIDVKEGRQNIIADLRPLKLFYAKNQFEQQKDEQQTSTMRKIAQDIGVDYFILGQVEPEDKDYVLKLQSYDVMADRYSSVFTKSLGSNKRKINKKIKSITQAWFDTELKNSIADSSTGVDFQEDFQEPEFTPKKEKKGFDKKWLWIGLGAVAVGAGAALIFSGSDGSDANVLQIDNPLN